MATVVSKKLSIDDSNIEQYCDAQNVSFNVSDHAWRKWLNGSTNGYIILKTEGKSAIYPTDTAKPIKADSTISASRSAGTCTVDLQFGGKEVHKESYTSGSQTSKSKSGITDAAVTNSTKATEIKWHVYGKNGDNQRGDLLELTLYFNQYSMSANIGTDANGVKTVSSSSSVAYDGDTIAFSAELYTGATWHGWYSDAACTNLVSSAQSYSVSPNADLTLYAKATLDAALYTCAAVAGTEIASATVSESTVVDGDTCTFTATANTGCTFDGWYSDAAYTTLISTSNPYTATITADTTLYAKAVKVVYTIGVGTGEHCEATVSTSSAHYGDVVTYTCSFTARYEFKGWYSDSACTTLISEANPYNHSVVGNVILYPKVGVKTYNLILHPTGYDEINFPEGTLIDNVTCLYTNDSSSTSYAKFRVTKSDYTAIGFYVDGSKFAEMPSNAVISEIKVSTNMNVILTSYVSIDAIYTANRHIVNNIATYSQVGKRTYQKNDVALVKTTYSLSNEEVGNWNAATLKNGNFGVVLECYYRGNNSYNTVYIYNIDISVSYTIPEESQGTQIYLKQNGAYKQAQAIYKKVNGVWTATDKTALDTTTKYKIINT